MRLAALILLAWVLFSVAAAGVIRATLSHYAGETWDEIANTMGGQ